MKKISLHDVKSDDDVPSWFAEFIRSLSTDDFALVHGFFALVASGIPLINVVVNRPPRFTPTLTRLCETILAHDDDIDARASAAAALEYLKLPQGSSLH